MSVRLACHVTRAVLVGCLLWAVVALWSRSDAVFADEKAANDRFETNGAVVDADGEPLPGARITTYPRIPGDKSVETISDKKGKFTLRIPALSGLPGADRVMAAVMKPGFAIAGFDSAKKPIRVVMMPEQEVEVKVLDPTDKPVVGATVMPGVIHHRKDFLMAPPPMSWSDDLAVTTNQDGIAKLKYVRPDALENVVVESDRWGRQQVDALRQFPMTLVMRHVGEIEGQLLDTKKRPLGSVSILASPSKSPHELGATTTDVEGRFHFKVPVGEYRLLVQSADRVSAELGRASIRENEITYVQLAMQLSVLVRGVVFTDDGRPAQQVPLAFLRETLDRRLVTTDENGKFELRLQPGKWQYRCYVDETPGYVTLTDESQTIEVNDRDVELPMLTVGAGRIVDGAILGLDTRKPRIRIVIVAIGEKRYWAEYDTDGKFRLTVPKDVVAEQIRQFEIRDVEDPIKVLSSEPLRLMVKSAK